jgi:hypothetical protein
MMCKSSLSNSKVLKYVSFETNIIKEEYKFFTKQAVSVGFTTQIRVPVLVINLNQRGFLNSENVLLTSNKNNHFSQTLTLTESVW